MSNRIVFGLQKILFFRASDHLFLGGLAHPASVAFNGGRQVTPVRNAAGQQVGEFTTGYQAECTLSGIQDASPNLEAIMCGRSTVTNSDAAIAAAKGIVIDEQVGDWSNVTVTPSANTPPGLYLVESTAAAAETVTRLGQLGLVDEGSTIERVVANSGITIAGAGRAALADTGKAIVAIEPACEAAHISIGGRPGVAPPRVTMLATSDPTGASDDDDRNAKWLLVPEMRLNSDMVNLTAVEPASMDGTYAVYHNEAIGGTHAVGHYQGIVQSALAALRDNDLT